jgi:hypothetical protein
MLRTSHIAGCREQITSSIFQDLAFTSFSTALLNCSPYQLPLISSSAAGQVVKAALPSALSSRIQTWTSKLRTVGNIQRCVRRLSSTPQVQVARLDRLILPRTAVFLAQRPGPIELSDAKGFTDAASSHGISHFVYSSVDCGGSTLSHSDPSYCKAFSDKY